MNPITKLRFDSLAGDSRTPWLPLIVRELGWFEEANEKVLGMLARDITDNDFSYFILGRDAKGRFRAVNVESSIATVTEAEASLERDLSTHAAMPPEEFYQGDETGKPVDFFKPSVREELLNRDFVKLASERGLSPARELISDLMYYFEDVDKTFVRQFQTTGFDARVWELYLYALFTELGYGFDRSQPSPDYHCQGPFGEFFVEATTVNPADDPPKVGENPDVSYFENYVPIKFSNVLLKKLEKRYWDLSHVQGKPLVFAVQDFHATRATSWSNTSLVEYLYGIRQTRKNIADGSSSIVSEPIKEFIWGKKKVPGDFFSQPHAENVSAVIANSEGTI